MEIENVKFDCKHFKGHIPCVPNKNKDAVCDTCDDYIKISKKILIIKLGAIGDVIRTTPLIIKFKQLYPNAHFTWITLYPDVFPTDEIDNILRLDAISIFKITNDSFDIAINLDKDKEACMLLTSVNAIEKYGFLYSNGHIDIATENAKHKLLTGLFDNISKINKKSYLEEIFEICHLDFNYEEYLIRLNEHLVIKWHKEINNKSKGKKIIGLNTGCGERWKTRLWPNEYWIDLINRLQNLGYFCMLLGGSDEDEQNRIYANKTGAHYPGHFSLEEFFSLSSSCDVIITPVSLMMHIAIALKKQMILFNNIFNPHEFELYGRGILMEPTSGCDCFYGNTCKRDISCMHDISVEDVANNVIKLTSKK
jgi:ADP-heptose:LPS heptosyltransferase